MMKIFGISVQITEDHPVYPRDTLILSATAHTLTEDKKFKQIHHMGSVPEMFKAKHRMNIWLGFIRQIMIEEKLDINDIEEIQLY